MKGMDNTPNGMHEGSASQNSAPAVHTNTLMAVLSYLGILIIIPFITEAKNDPFVKFHMRQGFVLIISWVVAFILGMVPIIGLLATLLDLLLFILMIIGIVNAVGGKMKQLPVIGNWASSFNF
jgi:uncharacterized membrane protein